MVPRATSDLPPDVEDDIDAFLKRYEQLVGTIQEELFKAIAILGAEDVRSLACREVAELMARLGAISSADRFGELVAIRNRIAHIYPDDPDRQSANLNSAYEAIADLLAVYRAVRAYL